MIKNYINGQWGESQGRESVEVVNPATKELLDRCPLGTPGDVDRAVQAASSAFVSWRRTPVIDRVQPFFRLKTLMEENLPALARQVTIENGKILAEAIGSVRRAIQMVETACGMPSLMMGQFSEDIAGEIDCLSVRQPIGVFASINPFNFPAMVPFWFWPFAVAAGNTFIVKPSERVPLTQIKIFELIEKAGFPKGVINMVQGGKEVVNALLAHPTIKGISFVGSTPVAKYVYQTGTANLKRVQALGGAKNSMVVLPDASLEKSARVAFESITGCAGERCLAGSVVICVGDEVDRKFRDLVIPIASDTIVGNGLEARVQMGPVISEAARERIKGLIQSAVDEGADLLLDGRKNLGDLPGFFLRPTVIGGVRPGMRIAEEEIFGPVVCLAKVDSFDDAIRWINSSPYGNTTTLFTTSGAAARKFSYEVDPGMVGINIGVPAPMAFFSFGGRKDSFFGDVKAHGNQCINFFTDTKVITERWLKDSSIW
ncbi:MAG: CoA-acylating methylmalonate-semialdehyde dehydrogenase [Deltaproteobacteria bacterium]|nr:CoA-acylating methylmalonate-semialdehyde dehydrogenase [Deltaproteobacteria bacterium]MBI2500085.1 CoA-acylating methylmalonate-semialdehyde dehydrogenase [Deltaproteobacteria bacterium]MBI4196186.1 CoA-acylating methylmalonate-semialdehyde dehydrogenase [Deltaproteobacteria bacterium]